MYRLVVDDISLIKRVFKLNSGWLTITPLGARNVLLHDDFDGVVSCVVLATTGEVDKGVRVQFQELISTLYNETYEVTIGDEAISLRDSLGVVTNLKYISESIVESNSISKLLADFKAYPMIDLSCAIKMSELLKSEVKISIAGGHAIATTGEHVLLSKVKYVGDEIHLYSKDVYKCVSAYPKLQTLNVYHVGDHLVWMQGSVVIVLRKAKSESALPALKYHCSKAYSKTLSFVPDNLFTVMKRYKTIEDVSIDLGMSVARVLTKAGTVVNVPIDVTERVRYSINIHPSILRAYAWKSKTKLVKLAISDTHIMMGLSGISLVMRYGNTISVNKEMAMEMEVFSE